MIKIKKSNSSKIQITFSKIDKQILSIKKNGLWKIQIIPQEKNNGK